MLRLIYNLLFYLALPIILLRLLFKARLNRAYLIRLKERFGLYEQKKPIGASIWIHSVSVGETIACAPLVKRLAQDYPDLHIVMTTMTPTGAERVQALFAETVTHFYVPYDLAGAVKRFLAKVQPKAVIIMETEIWPNLMHHCHQQNIPVMLANARLSAKSAKGYAKLGSFIRQILGQFSLIAAQSSADVQRFIDIGAQEQQLEVVGNMKFDQQISATVREKADYFRDLWCRQRSMWVAASTHEGEDEIILDSFAKVLEQVPNALLLLVPRHPERFGKVAQMARKRGYGTMLRSQDRACDESIKVLVGDSMGELAAYYAAADLAFVGGSLIPIGGHNVLEPAALGVAAITGKYMFNFSEITELLLQAGGLKQIETGEELTSLVVEWLQDGAKRAMIGEKGQQVVEKNRGSVEKHLQLFKGILDLQS